MQAKGEDRGIRILQLVFLFFLVYETYSILSPYLSDANEFVLGNTYPSSSIIPEPNYEESDAMICNERVDGIMKLFRSIQFHNLKTRKTTGKFIIYQAPLSSGLGNRISPLVSAALLSIIVGRGFLVHWPMEAETTNPQDEHMMMPQFSELFETPFTMNAAEIPDFYESLNTDNAIRFTLQTELANLLLCHDLIDLYDEKRFIVFAGFRSFVDMLTYNKKYSGKMEELGISQDLIHELGRCILSPVGEVQDVLAEFSEYVNASQPRKMVGIHIRALSNHSLSPLQEQHLWHCVFSKYPPPPPSTPRSNATYLYFLASDSNATVLRAPEEAKPYLITQQGKDITRTTKQGLLNAIADIWMLGNCVEVFGVRRTTFLNSVLTLFSTPLTFYPFFPHKKQLPCERVTGFPCFMNWNVSRDYNFTCPSPIGKVLC